MITLTLPYPPSTNGLWRSSKRKDGTPYVHRTKRYMTWLNSAGWEIRAQKPSRIDGPVEITIVLKRGAKNHDLDNRIKPILDALQKFHVIEDDKYVQRLSVEWGDENRVRVDPVVVALAEAAE